MKLEDLPKRWQVKLDEHLAKKSNYWDPLGAEDFPANTAIKLTFPDGSTAQFNYALLLKAPELKEVALFTEHCGYHIFPQHGLQVEELTI